MITLLSDYFIAIRYFAQVQSKNGFPYCVMLYTLAFVANGIIALMCIVRGSKSQLA